MARSARLKLFALCSDWRDIAAKLSILSLEPKTSEMKLAPFRAPAVRWPIGQFANVNGIS